MSCPAWIRFVESLNLPDTGSGDAATRGTAGHEIVESMYDGHFLEVGDTASNGFVITEDLHEEAMWCFDWVASQGFDRIFVEERVPVGAAVGIDQPDIMWGTCDLIGIKNRTYHVIDYKFGRVPVPSKPVQAMAYLAGALHLIEPPDRAQYRITILQPGVTRDPIVEKVTRKELDRFAAETRDAVALALSDNAPFGPSEDGCRYCPGSGACRAQMEWAIAQDFDEIDPEDLTDAEIASFLEKEKLILLAMAAIKTQAQQRLSMGRKIPGFKLVESITRRKWRDEEELIEYLQASNVIDLDIAMPRTLLSPAQMEKKVKGVEKFIEHPRGNPTIAPDSDKRPALEPDFEQLETVNMENGNPF